MIPSPENFILAAKLESIFVYLKKIIFIELIENFEIITNKKNNFLSTYMYC